MYTRDSRIRIHVLVAEYDRRQRKAAEDKRSF
jgi:hypothetical protein